MNDITPLERRLIDEAIAAGRVRKIPRGASAFQDGATMLEGENGKNAARRKMWSGVGQRQKGAALRAAERRDKIMALADGTRTGQQIADALNLPIQRVTADLHRLRKHGHSPRLLNGNESWLR